MAADTYGALAMAYHSLVATRLLPTASGPILRPGLRLFALFSYLPSFDQ